MVSLRFTFLFSQPQKPLIARRSHARSCGVASAVACSVAAVGAAVAASQDPSNPFLRDALNFYRSNFNRSSPVWGSLSLAADPSPVTDPKTGVAFPSVLGDSRRLLGIGLRRKCVMGLKNIDVYTFGTAIAFPSLASVIRLMNFNFHFTYFVGICWDGLNFQWNLLGWSMFLMGWFTPLLYFLGALGFSMLGGSVG
ncbi:chalcone-flavanone isomerase family protein [Actinidia rufa]|uniref:Chalcone-flavanone isomerase family protein n=1 Tax=Actinidia rufa TaxID=165716 RepID=A0A7J0G5G5_9ERIC|nr:chalcone-flavanone isomerase family protein [Actinidia rufa]